MSSMLSGFSGVLFIGKRRRFFSAYWHRLGFDSSLVAHSRQVADAHRLLGRHDDMDDIFCLTGTNAGSYGQGRFCDEHAAE